MRAAEARSIVGGVVVLTALVLPGLAIGAAGGTEAGSTGVATSQAAEETGGDVVTSRSGVIVPIDTDISDVTLESIKRRVENARERGADTIIFELNTPGGMLTSMLDICAYIKNLTDLKTVAWVHTQAYSAGTAIALACDEIVMSTRSTIGDCGVILGSPTGAEEVPEGLRAKAEAPALAEFRESSTRRGYDRLLCEAMILVEREVWWVEHVETGERKFVETKEKDKLLETREENAAEDTSREPALWKLVETFWNPVTKKDVKIDQPIVGTTGLLTMSQTEAYAFGFSKGIVNNEADLRTRYSLVGELPRITFTWSERLTGWLTSMPVRMFLLIIVLLGVYVEFNTPGVGVPGLVALIALAVFLGAPYLTGLANVWEIVVILIGVALLLVEIFVVPGFGVFGIGGIACILIGLLATFVPEEPGRGFPIYWPSMEPGLEGLRWGVVTLATALGGSFVGAIVISKYLHKIPLLNLAAPANPTPSHVTPEDPYRGAARVGDIGIAESPLRPSGRARFGATLVDVVTEGDWLDKNAEVEVIEHRGNHVVVRKITG